MFLYEGVIKYARIPTDNGKNGDRKKKNIAMLCVDRYIKRSPEFFFFYPNVNKRYLRFIEESSENTKTVAPSSIYQTIREGRRAPV